MRRHNRSNMNVLLLVYAATLVGCGIAESGALVVPGGRMPVAAGQVAEWTSLYPNPQVF
jgi:hypothetical protein